MGDRAATPFGVRGGDRFKDRARGGDRGGSRFGGSDRGDRPPMDRGGDRFGGYPSGGASGSVIDVHEDGTVRYVLARARGAACFARRIALTLVSYFGPRPCSARRVTVVHDGPSRYGGACCIGRCARSGQRCRPEGQVSRRRLIIVRCLHVCPWLTLHGSRTHALN